MSSSKGEKPMSTLKNVGEGVGLTTSAILVLLFSIKVGDLVKTNQATNFQKQVAGYFEKLAIGGKGLLILFLIVLALTNQHSEYAAKNPVGLFHDALATGGFGALAAVFLAFTRGRSDLALNHFIFALLLFFMYHICREYAGYFTVFGNQKASNLENKEMKAIGKPLAILMAATLFVAVLMAFLAKISPDYTTGILKGFGPSTALIIETIGFVSLITMGEVVVARNHKDPIGPAVGASAVMFTLAHLVLQGGGFYEHLYAH